MTSPQGLLTQEQRDFLKADSVDEEYSRQQRYRFRKNIRRRISNGIKDFELLFRELPNDQLKRLFETEVVEMDTDRELREDEYDILLTQHFAQMVAFIARAHDLEDAQIFPQLGRGQPALEGLFTTFDKGIRTWLLTQKGMFGDVNTNVEFDDVKPVEAIVDAAKKEGAEGIRELTLFDKLALMSFLSDEENIAAIERAYEEQRPATDE